MSICPRPNTVRELLASSIECFKRAKCYALEGLEKVLVLNRNVNSDNANRKIDGALEARIIAMACREAPEGRSRWTVKLITEEARVKLELTAGEEAVRRMLKKTSCVLT